MELSDFIDDYLCDNKEGIKGLITRFLNSVMPEETARQSCSTPPKELIVGKHTVTDSNKGR